MGERKCFYCNKVIWAFHPGMNWTYKTPDHKRFCSYSCMRAYEREKNEKKQEAKK